MKSWLFSTIGLMSGVLVIDLARDHENGLPAAIFSAACLIAGGIYRLAESREKTMGGLLDLGKSPDKGVEKAEKPRILNARSIVERVSLSVVKGKTGDGD